VFIVLRLLFRFLEKSSIDDVCVKGPWDSPGWIEYGPASAMDLTGADYLRGVAWSGVVAAFEARDTG
jgi:hypothetical protein